VYHATNVNDTHVREEEDKA